MYLEFVCGVQHIPPYVYPCFFDELVSWQNQLTSRLRNDLRTRNHIISVIREFGLFHRPPQNSTGVMTAPILEYSDLDLHA